MKDACKGDGGWAERRRALRAEHMVPNVNRVFDWAMVVWLACNALTNLYVLIQGFLPTILTRPIATINEKVSREFQRGASVQRIPPTAVLPENTVAA